jgi:E3 ubiquitin-protein ligase HERC2|tara:strand:+ start:91 stop:465 length:375 start_codon:yes stop_codon:yes gene_type:complete
LGHGDTQSLSIPKRITTFKENEKIINALAGAKHSVAVTSGNGLIFSWGMGDQGRLGNGQEIGCLLPSKIPMNGPGVLAGDDMCMHVATGEAHTAMVTASGNVYTWGVGSHGRLGRTGSLFCVLL